MISIKVQGTTFKYFPRKGIRMFNYRGKLFESHTPSSLQSHLQRHPTISLSHQPIQVHFWKSCQDKDLREWKDYELKVVCSNKNSYIY